MRAQDRLAFCTEFSRSAGEPLAGWGGHQAKNLLIRWPKGRWAHSLRIASDMPSDLVRAIGAVVEAGWRVNLIDRKSYDMDTVRTYLFPQSEAFDVPPSELARWILTVATVDRAPASSPARHVPGPLVLCCTHGKHDRCCAKFGYAAYRAINAAAQTGDGVSVWESSHLGGCRLSASALVLPSLRKYGSLTPRDAEPFLTAEIEDRPYLPAYRGASHLGPAAQAAEVAARTADPVFAVSRSVDMTTIEESKKRCLFGAHCGGRRLEIECLATTVQSFGSCEDMASGEAPAFRRVWSATVLS